MLPIYIIPTSARLIKLTGVLKSSFSDSKIYGRGITASILIASACPRCLLYERKESDLHRKSTAAPWDGGMRELVLSLYCFWTKIRQNFILIHVFSVLLLAYETVESTAEEKYLIYTLEKALLQTNFNGNSWGGIFRSSKLLLQKKKIAGDLKKTLFTYGTDQALLI